MTTTAYDIRQRYPLHVRQNYSRQLDKVVGLEAKIEEMQQEWADTLKARMACLALQGTPQYDRPAYKRYKARMSELERAIVGCKHELHWAEMWLSEMPVPKRRRPRKTIVIDGIRTKLERA